MFILEEMDYYGADGVDFVPILTSPYDTMGKVIYSWSRDEVEKNRFYPKSGRLYWKIVNGRKFYLIEKRESNG